MTDETPDLLAALRDSFRRPPATSDDVVSRARAALDGITPGPWEVGRALLDDSEHHFVSPTGGLDGSILGFTDAVADYCGPDDAAFIAAAPDLVRDLLAENEQLRDDLRVERTVTHMCESVDADLREARAEVERLTAERDQVIAAHQRAEARATLHREERDDSPHLADVHRLLHQAHAREADIWHHLSLAAGGPVGTHGDAIDAIASLRREVTDAGAAELRVRLLHSPVDCRGTDEQRCQECISEQWPCPTIRALDREADRA